MCSLPRSTKKSTNKSLTASSKLLPPSFLSLLFCAFFLFPENTIWYGSKKSRKASPIKLNPSVTPNKNHTGVNSHGNALKFESVERSRLIREPQLTAGSVIPSPRYERTVSVIIKPGTLNATLTIKRLAICGIMCLKMITTDGIISSFAFRTNSSRLIAWTIPRIVLAELGQPTRERITVIIM